MIPVEHQIADMIASNPSGGTVHRHLVPLRTEGYFVGGAGAALVFPSENRIDRQLLRSFVTSVEAGWIGWWTDEETGKVWVDQSSWYHTELTAGAVGRERGEIAIYDVARQRELRLS